jgi:DeoR/GlpR family transcriptional regulator of sugar metabolism
MSELFLEERRQKILLHLEKTGRVSVSVLSQLLGVSEVTIRSDLQALAEQQLIIRTHGGAIPAGNGRNEMALTLRRQQQVDIKRRIGIACANLIPNDSAIVLDSSSTALAIVQHLKNHHRLTIVTNSLVVAQEMIDASGVTVVMPGGTLHPETASLIGTAGLESLKKFNIQQGFFGAHGVTLSEGLTDVSTDEAGIKNELLKLCRRKIAVVDTTKWGRVGLAAFARIADFHTIITDVTAPDTLTRKVNALGVEIITV